MKVAVGSSNHFKVLAVKKVFSKVVQGVEVIPVEVPSFPQPLGFQTWEGAEKRAREAAKSGDVGVGIEGGIFEFQGRFYCTAVAAIFWPPILSFGSGPWFEIPRRWATEVLRGRELGDIVDEEIGEKGFHEGRGAAEYSLLVF